MTQSVTFPEIISKGFNDDFTLFNIKEDDSNTTYHLTIEDTCNAMMEAGIIDDYHEEEGVIMIDIYVSDEESVHERLEVKYIDLLDFIGQLSLEECGRVLTYHKASTMEKNDLSF